MGTGCPRAKGTGINKPKYSGDSGAAEWWRRHTLRVVLAKARTQYPGEKFGEDWKLVRSPVSIPRALA